MSVTENFDPAQASDIAKAYFHSLREHKIGETDGFSPDVAADLGFDTQETAIERLKTMEPRRQEAALNAGRVLCGDCGEVIPCQHAGKTPKGKGYTRG